MLSPKPWITWPSTRLAIVAPVYAPSWAQGAACAELEPDAADAIFFPNRGHTAEAARAERDRKAGKLTPPNPDAKRGPLCP